MGMRALWRPATAGLVLLALAGCQGDFLEPAGVTGGDVAFAKGSPGPPDGGETFGNNLSFPVLWAEGVAKTLQGTPGMDPVLNGEWWYWWGTAPDDTPLSCPPDPDDETYCDDEIPLQATGDLPGTGAVKAFLQKDPQNVWQAGAADFSTAALNVDWIDWGDNLESVDWYTRSQVRTELVLFQDLTAPMLEYQMRHVSGWGIDEVHGLAATLANEAMTGLGTQATIYSHCARLTIQLLLTDRDNPNLASLVWVPEVGWTGTLVNPPIFNQAVYDGGDGPGYYSAEINVKGRIIYGYTWNVRKDKDDTLDPDGAGDYRITFSFDETCGTESLNTFFDESTQIMVPAEEEEVLAAAEEGDDGGDTGGATPEMVPLGTDEFGNTIGNYTYMDVRILGRGGGGGGGGKEGKGGGGGGPKH